ncbi:hypothetical protein B0H17DRAFT_1074566, partial [Mycena rosella]
VSIHIRTNYCPGDEEILETQTLVAALQVKRLDDEIAVRIPLHRNCVMSAVEAPILLGRICSSWRAISHATPRLWARLHI